MAFQTQQSQQLYPRLGRDPQMPLRPAGGESTPTLTQDDLDRVWKPIFEEYYGGDGCCQGCTIGQPRIPLKTLKQLLSAIPTDEADAEAGFAQLSRRNRVRATQIQDWRIPMPRRVLEIVTKQADADGDGWVEYDEFCDVILHNKEQIKPTHLQGLEKIVQSQVDAVTPDYYHETYSCCPPPLFIPLISLVEIAVFIWYCVEYGTVGANTPVPVYSPLMYDPKRRYEAWRFVSYMLVHAGAVHIVFNMLLQLLFGIPLEMVHKGWRIMLIYILGVLIGALAHSVTDFDTMLCGASGGVYALVGAHVANVVMNYKEMRFGIVRSLIFGVLIVADVALALYKRYGTDEDTKVGYMAHLGGFFGGLFLGIVCLKNLKVKSYERVLWYIALVIFLLLILIGVLVNTFYQGYEGIDAINTRLDLVPLNNYYKYMFDRYGPKD